MVITYAQKKFGFNADTTVVIRDSKEFNEWAIKVNKDLWDGYWFYRMAVDGDEVDFGRIVTEGQIALHTTDFKLVKMRVDCTKLNHSTVNI